jgi:hypothetical protein
VPRRRIALSAWVLALALAAGCSGDSDDSGADAPGSEDTTSASGDGGDGDSGGNACDLLTEDEVSAAVGVEVNAGQGADGPVATGGTQETCKWSSVDSPIDTATITIYSETSAADSVRDADPDAAPLEGVGDEAFVSSFASVWAYVGEQSFMAQWYAMEGTDDENLPMSEALAKLVADNL